MIAFRLSGPLTGVLLLFVLASILAAVVTPLAARLESRGIPRFLTAISIVLLGVGALTGLVWVTVPRIVGDIYGFATRLNLGQVSLADYLNRLWQNYPLLAELLPRPEDMLRRILPDPYTLLNGISRTLFNTFSSGLWLILLVVLVVHAVGRPTPLVAGWLTAVPERYRPPVEAIIRRSMEQFRHWAFGTLILALMVGGLTAIGLWSVGRLTGNPFPYLLLFSVIAAIGEVIPIVGPILSAIPPALVALTIDPMLALWVLLVFLVIQQVENNIIVPWVMAQSVDLHPFSLIFVLMVMQALFGILGAFLATPAAIIIKICWEELYLKRSENDAATAREHAEQLVSEEASASD